MDKVSKERERDMERQRHEREKLEKKRKEREEARQIKRIRVISKSRKVEDCVRRIERERGGEKEWGRGGNRVNEGEIARYKKREWERREKK